MANLIADSGLHFETIETEFNPDQPLILPNGKVEISLFMKTILVL